MLPVSFPGCNAKYGPPEGWKDEDCSTVPALRYFCEDCLCIHILLQIMCNLEDLNSINKNLPIFIKVVSEKAFPFMIFAGEIECTVKHECNGTDEKGLPFQLFYVIPDKQQKALINEFGFIFYRVKGPTIEPFFMYTVDEQGNGNF